ncbi:MAG: hypothetical protein ACR2QM_20665 [Longimicrobiales bacterium]
MSKNHRSWYKAPFAGLLLALQLGAVGLVPAADGVLELASITQPVHIESGSGSDCPPSHDHFVCQLCRIAGPKLVPEVASVLRAAIWVSPTSDATPDVFDSAGVTRASPLGARAPPLA